MPRKKDGKPANIEPFSRSHASGRESACASHGHVF
jgi:hypothetical protein